VRGRSVMALFYTVPVRIREEIEGEGETVH